MVPPVSVTAQQHFAPKGEKCSVPGAVLCSADPATENVHIQTSREDPPTMHIEFQELQAEQIRGVSH